MQSHSMPCPHCSPRKAMASMWGTHPLHARAPDPFLKIDGRAAPVQEAEQTGNITSELNRPHVTPQQATLYM